MRFLHLFILLFTIITYGTETLPYELEKKIKLIPLNSNNYSIHIQEVNAKDPIASWNAHKERAPASVIKVLTTYAGLLDLGYNHRWETKFFHTGYISKGTLRGDFIVKGSGDPTLGTKDLDDIITQFQSFGIKSILGNIVIDRTLFDVSTKNNSGFDRNKYSPYNAMPDAMMFNQRKSTLCVTSQGKHINIQRDIPDWSYKVVNKIRPVNGSCKKGRSWPRVSISEKGSESVITFSGKLAKRCGKRTICKIVTKPYRSFYYALKGEMKKRGIKFEGTIKLHRTPNKATYLFSHYSVPLEDIISVIAKKSNNLMARQLMLTLGAKHYGSLVTPYKGGQAIEKILNQHNILEYGTTFIANGSGLSRVSKLTAQSLGNLLKHGANNYGQRWMNTLSIAGIDGTIRRRFRHSTVYGRAWMKTGTIKRVSNIAGYVEGNSGARYVVVVLVNDKKSSRYGRKLANTVIEWVANNL